MADKIYEMPDEYNRVAEILVSFIKTRDEAIEAMKYMTPAQRFQAQIALKDINSQIEKCEVWLAKEYESYQAKFHNEALVAEQIEKGMQAVVNLFIEYKNHRPEKLEDLKAVIFKDFPENEIREFYDRVAIREAEQLEENIAAKK